jgi:CubicO group peptidase (beta-lactamase class C family)
MNRALRPSALVIRAIIVFALAVLPWLIAGTTAAEDQAAVSAVKDAKAEEAWLRHGFTGAQRDKIRTALQRGIDQKFVPGGALLIIHRGEPILREGFGVASLETRQPFAIDAPCRIASVTKPHTSTLVAMLVEQGKLSWDDPVDKYLPTFAGIAVRDKGPATRTPKVRELLSHTAGFPGQPAIDSGRWKIKSNGTLADAVADLPAQGLAAEPGTGYAYTGLGYMVAGRIAELVTGKEYGALMKEMLLEPIGAKAATFYPSDELKARVPTAYERKDGEFVKLDPASRPRAAAAFPNPAGSLISTVDDVGRLLMLHRNRGQVDGKQLVKPESLQALYQRQPATGRTSYGLGFNVVKVNAKGEGIRVRHTGASGTFAQLDFENDLIFVLLTQVPQTQTQPFRDGLLKAVAEVFSSADSGAN